MSSGLAIGDVAAASTLAHDAWQRLYDILFPGTPLPSPYYGDDYFGISPELPEERTRAECHFDIEAQNILICASLQSLDVAFAELKEALLRKAPPCPLLLHIIKQHFKDLKFLTLIEVFSRIGRAIDAHFITLYALSILFFWWEYPHGRRYMCTTMPWTIWPALVVLWGVCWMFYPPPQVEQETHDNVELGNFDLLYAGPEFGLCDFDFDFDQNINDPMPLMPPSSVMDFSVGNELAQVPMNDFGYDNYFDGPDQIQDHSENAAILISQTLEQGHDAVFTTAAGAPPSPAASAASSSKAPVSPQSAHIETTTAQPMTNQPSHIHGPLHACTKCDKRYARPCDLTRHIKRKHDKPISCELCIYKCSASSELEKHMDSKHRPRTLFCPHSGCPRAADALNLNPFAKTDNLADHDKRVHARGEIAGPSEHASKKRRAISENSDASQFRTQRGDDDDMAKRMRRLEEENEALREQVMRLTQAVLNLTTPKPP